MRIVVKVGTSTLAHPGGLLNIRHTEDLVRVWSDIQNAGHQLIVVSSAATGLGAGKLQIEKPSDLVTKQAAAAVGQCELMYTYDRLFGQYNHTVAQMLLTWEDFDHENRLHNLQNTLERLLQLHAIPIINENDPVACEEYSLGDNDTLAALVAKCIHADLVVLMSDIDGLYTADPHTHPDAKLIPVVEEITPEIEMLAGGAGSALGTGGMLTKVTAAKRATEAGVDMIITNGAHAEVLYDIVEGKPVGTRFVGRRHTGRSDPMTTQEILQAAQGAKLPLALADADTKNAALEAMAVALIAAQDKILQRRISRTSRTPAGGSAT